jgi:hypothetical protein
MVKYRMVVRTGREKVDVAVDRKLQPAAGTIVDKRERKN